MTDKKRSNKTAIADTHGISHRHYLDVTVGEMIEDGVISEEKWGAVDKDMIAYGCEELQSLCWKVYGQPKPHPVVHCTTCSKDTIVCDDLEIWTVCSGCGRTIRVPGRE